MVLLPGVPLQTGASPLPGSPRLQLAGGMGLASRAATAPALVQLHPPLMLLFPSPVPTVRSPPGLAKTPLSALGLKPHNPAEILLHPVGGECRAGAEGGFFQGTSMRTPLGGSLGWRRRFCLPVLARWLWGPCRFPSGYGDVLSNVPAGEALVVEAGKRQGPGSSSPFFLPPPFILSPPSAAGFAAPPSRPVSQNSIQNPLHPGERSLSSFLLLAGFLGAALRGGSSLGCSLIPTPSLGSGHHLWGAQVGRWRCLRPGLGRRGALLRSLCVLSKQDKAP